ncbi:1,4-dihydroxy-2-naphthoate octaprenyltransferase [Mariniflexile sp.]|uniref:1,4-dihydroxy-2-naphthoate octaprenyltransferase n=1 Tax=Mariniflexile sp. TaxID=1979402 RepID=UPI004048DD2A
MKHISVWLSTMRLRTLPLSISGIILGSFFAEYNGYFVWNIFILAILTTLSFQILSNFANDYGDGIKGTDSNDRLGPGRAVQTGKLSAEDLFGAIKINVLISIILALLLIFTAFGVKYFLLTVLFFLLGIAAVAAAIRYTMGDSPYGYKGMGDFYVFLFFGLISVIGSYVLYAKTIDHLVFLPAFTIGLLSVAVLNLNNMRDIVSDEKSKKITLAVKLGINNAKKYHIGLIVSAIVLSGLFGILYYTSLYNFIFFITYIPLIIHIKKVIKNKDPKMLDPELKKVALTTVALAVLMGIGYLM